jgi:hypothetical protein
MGKHTKGHFCLWNWVHAPKGLNNLIFIPLSSLLAYAHVIPSCLPNGLIGNIKNSNMFSQPIFVFQSICMNVLTADSIYSYTTFNMFKSLNHRVTYLVCVTIRRGLDRMIVFTAHMHSTRNYKWLNTIAHLLTLQLTVTHTLGFSVFTSRILATDFNTVIIPVSL